MSATDPEREQAQDAPQSEDATSSPASQQARPAEEPARDPSAPPGAVCAAHPERDAHFTCPRCGDHACVFCWHPSLQRCDACLRRDPAGAAPPVPWESPGGSGPGRYLQTLRDALSPARTAPSFARPELHRAVRFLLLSALPLSLLAGIVPHTRTLVFEGGLSVRLLDNPSGAAILLDVVRAMFAQVALDGLQLLACALPFTSLVRAYAGPERVPFALRMLLYRAWLHPAASLGLFVLIALAPAATDASGVPEPSAPVLLMAAMLRIAAPVLFMMAMAYTARLACGLGMGWSIVIMCISITVAGFVAWAANQGLLLALPPVPPLG